MRRIKLSLQYFFQLLIGDTVSLFCLIFSPLIKILQIADTIITTIQMSYEITAHPNKNQAVAVILGRLAVRAVMNLLLGGTMFGGNFL